MNLKGRVYQLTAEFSDAFTRASVALNSIPASDEAPGLVRECQRVGQRYEAALDSLLEALRGEAERDEGEIARMDRLKAVLKRELELVLSHPHLRSEGGAD